MLNNFRPLSWLGGHDNDWRPTPMTPALDAALKADSAMENAAGDRVTCYTHQCWWGDCITSPSHANPITKFNWCDEHHRPVQICRCRPPATEG